VAGVASGLARHLDVDPFWIRVAFVVLAITGGFGVILYIAGWVLIPEEPYGGVPFAYGGMPAPPGAPPPPRAHGEGNDARLILGVVFLFIAALVLAGTFDFHDAGLIWGAALIGIGVLLLFGDSGFGRSPVAPPPAPGEPAQPAGFTPSAAGSFTSPPGTQTPSQTGQYAPSGFTPATPYGYARPAYGTPPWSAAATQWPPAAPPARGIRLGTLTLALMLLVVGVAALLTSAGVLHMTVALGFGLAFIVLGAALIIGSRFGRAHWLIALGICLVPFAAAAVLIPEPLTGGVGQVRFAPQTVTALQPAYRLAAGQLTVDLSGIDLSDQSVTVTASDAVGQLIVIVPDGTAVDVTSKVGAGEIDILGTTNSGVQIAARSTGSTGGATTGTLDLNLSVGCGQITVETADDLSALGRAGSVRPAETAAGVHRLLGGR
jgi:phage shock protein PspC (stress-responsive transcriptional regulator)